MRKTIRYGAWVSLAAALVLICAGFSCSTSVKSAAVGVNKYAESLSHLQDAEITAHNAGSVDDATHKQILEAEKLASKAGHELDTAIALAAQGADASQYVDAAQNTFNDLLDVINPTNKQELVLLAQASGALLKNAISLIHAIHPAPVKPSPAGLAFWMMGFGLIGMAAIDVNGVIQLLNLVVSLEPAAFDLVLKLTQSLQGQSTDQVLAMNEAIFGKVDATADAELAKLADKK